MPSGAHTTAERAYDTAMEEAKDLITDLRRFLAGHDECTQADGVHWGHVGDITEISALLKRALRNEQEASHKETV